MKRIAISLGVVVTTVVLGASTALAQYPPKSTPPTDPGSPAGGSLPFTGANISWGLVLVVALVVTGAVLLFTGRRRSRTP